MKFELRRLTDYSDDALMEEIRRVALILGTNRITIRAFNKSSKVNATTIIRRFGSWVGALEKAGCLVAKTQRRHFSDQELFENLLAVWTHLGRPPKFKEMAWPPSKFGGKPYMSRFGKWNRALAAFVDQVNRDNANEIVRFSEDGIVQLSMRPAYKNATHRGEEDRRDIRLGVRFAILQRDRFRCVACGSSPATHAGCVLHVDHVLPFSKGGKTRVDNLRTLCAHCNVGRGNRFED